MRFLYLAITIILFSSCEDVIDLPLEEGPKLLVIDANINWEKEGIDNATQKIRLTETAGFYDVTIPVATGAIVNITNENGDVITFTEDGNSGIYITTGFIEPNPEEVFTLNIDYQGETFTAKEKYKTVADIDSIAQTVQPLFGTDLIKIEFFYEDPEDEENYYINQFNYPDFLIDSYGTRSDEFSNGQLNSIFTQSEEYEAGKPLKFYFYGSSKTFFNYFNLLLDQIQSGGPFATPPAEVIGNCINETNIENKPKGYFRVSEMVKITYTIKELE